MNNLIVCNTIVKEDLEDRYCLNDLHRASGNNPKDKPSNWLRSDKTKEFIEELQQFSETRSVIETINGGIEPGTYAIKEIVYAYAMWISPKFQVQVIRAYDDMLNNSNPYIKASRKELLKLAYEHEEKIEMLKEQVEYLEPFKEKVDNSKVIFSKKESVYDEEKGFKKNVKDVYPFLSNAHISLILEHYTTKRYKDTDHYIKSELDCVSTFFTEADMKVSTTKDTVTVKHPCLLTNTMRIRKDKAIEYLDYTEEDFAYE